MLPALVYIKALRVQIADAAQSGQGLAEYGLIVALVSITAIIGLTGLGKEIAAQLTSVAGHL